jgi:Putative prokaryotic signal transducing protein
LRKAYRQTNDSGPKGQKPVRELVRTNNPVLISAITALLDGARIPHSVLDQNMSVLEGSLGILPRRILVDDERHDEACRLLNDAGLANEIAFGAGKSKSGNN